MADSQAQYQADVTVMATSDTRREVGPEQLPSASSLVAANLRRMRERAGLSQEQLAEQLARILGEPVAKSKVLQAEGRRSGTQPARHQTPEYLAACCVALNCTLFDLWLPPDDRQLVMTQAEAAAIEATPKGITVGVPVSSLEGRQVRVNVAVGLDADGMAQLLFGFPAAGDLWDLPTVRIRSDWSTRVADQLREVLTSGEWLDAAAAAVADATDTGLEGT